METGIALPLVAMIFDNCVTLQCLANTIYPPPSIFVIVDDRAATVK